MCVYVVWWWCSGDGGGVCVRACRSVCVCVYVCVWVGAREPLQDRLFKGWGLFGRVATLIGSFACTHIQHSVFPCSHHTHRAIRMGNRSYHASQWVLLPVTVMSVMVRDSNGAFLTPGNVTCRRNFHVYEQKYILNYRTMGLCAVVKASSTPRSYGHFFGVQEASNWRHGVEMTRSKSLKCPNERKTNNVSFINACAFKSNLNLHHRDFWAGLKL